MKCVVLSNFNHNAQNFSPKNRHSLSFLHMSKFCKPRHCQIFMKTYISLHYTLNMYKWYLYSYQSGYSNHQISSISIFHLFKDHWTVCWSSISICFQQSLLSKHFYVINILIIASTCQAFYFVMKITTR